MFNPIIGGSGGSGSSGYSGYSGYSGLSAAGIANPLTSNLDFGGFSGITTGSNALSFVSAAGITVQDGTGDYLQMASNTATLVGQNNISISAFNSDVHVTAGGNVNITPTGNLTLWGNKLGFYGTAAISKPAVTDATSLVNGLKNLGLISSSSFTGGFSGYSGISGYSGYSGISGFSGYSGKSGYSGVGTSGYSGKSGYSGAAASISDPLTIGNIVIAGSSDYIYDASALKLYTNYCSVEMKLDTTMALSGNNLTLSSNAGSTIYFDGGGGIHLIDNSSDNSIEITTAVGTAQPVNITGDGGVNIVSNSGNIHVNSDGSISASDADSQGFTFDSFGSGSVHATYLTITGSTIGLSGTTTITGDLILTENFTQKFQTLSFVGAGTTSFDASLGTIAGVTLTDDTTISFSNINAGGEYTLFLYQDGTGGRLVTWSGVLWSGGTAPTLSTGVGALDVINFIYDGTSLVGAWKGNFS